MLILASEYSKEAKTAVITVKPGINGKVTDLQTGMVIAKVNNKNRKFTVKLDKQRAKFFAITKE